MLSSLRPTVLAFLALPVVGAADSERPPNVILILADDLGYGEVGCYGQTKIQTPHLDRLAAGGMRFTQHYSGSPVCAPSRCVLLTGFHTGHSFIRGNYEVGGWGPDEPEGQLPLPAGTVTLSRLLKDQGFATGAFGKWGLGGPGSTGHPLNQGFDRFYGYLCQRVAHNYYPTHLWRNHDVDVLDGNRYFKAHQKVADVPEDWARFSGERFAPDEMLEEALEFLDASKDGPFFLYYPTPVPHVAIQVPDDSLAEYAGQFEDGPYLGQKGYLPHPEPRAGYAAMVTRMDRDIGALLERLDQHGLTDDTIVWFTSDNGPTFNGGTDSDYFESAAGMRGLKCSVYEGGVRVPLIVRWPGQVPAGAVSDRLTGFQDALPTLCELVGTKAPTAIDGLSFAGTLLGRDGSEPDRLLYWEYPERDGQQALRLGRWKAVRRNLKRGELAIELYDVSTDRAESKDVAAEHPEVVERMRELLFSERRPSPDFPIPALDQLK